MTEKEIIEKYKQSKEIYKQFGIDTDGVLDKLSNIKISIHCWQGDDVKGFFKKKGGQTAGIVSTGNYFGAARNSEELRRDLEMVLQLVPGKHKVNLHAIYLDTDEEVDLDKIEPKHFEKWVIWAKNLEIGLDFNPTFFSHENFKNGLTLSHPDERIRGFWIEHGKKSRKISEYFGKELDIKSYVNFWVPDGYKDTPVDTIGPRKRLAESLDMIFQEKIDEKYSIDTLESKLFGIGYEAYTVGSHEFYMGYALTRNKSLLLDEGHFHPTESISSKISSLALFQDRDIMLHVSRSIRWDSDHVVIMDDELNKIMQEIIRNDLQERVKIGLDYFDASINRIAAWVIGIRNVQKAILKALLEPIELLRVAEKDMDFTSRLVYLEEEKDLPYIDIWNYFCYRNGVPVGISWFDNVKQYEEDVLKDRKD